jgi:hypothetical protein
MKSKILLPSLAIIILTINMSCCQDNMINLLPAGRDGWVKSGEMEVYDRNNLFDYMDGGAELYLAYDFQKLVVQRYSSGSTDVVKGNSITVEIYQMNSSPDAYGLYSFDQEGETVEVGQKGVYGYGLLKFWKEKHLVRILGSRPDLRETVLKLGRDIDEKIRDEGALPELLSKIPKDELIPNSDHFFHKQILLNNLYFLSDKNILNLTDKTDCLLADFGSDGDILRLLVVEYPDLSQAENAYQSFNKLYLKGEASETDRIVEIEQGKLVGVDLGKNYLLLIFEGTEKEIVLRLLDSVKGHLR